MNNNKKYLRNVMYGVLVTNVLGSTFPDPSYAIDDTVKSIKKTIRRFHDKAQDTLEDLDTRYYRYLEEEPETFIEKVSQSLDHIEEKAEKVIKRKILRPLKKFIKKLLSSN